MSKAVDPREVWALLCELVLDNVRRREAAEALGMSFGRIRAIRRVARRPMSMGELAAALGVDPPNATALVNDLEGLGLVTRSPHPTDGRTKVVSATRKGMTIARRADEILSTPPAAVTGLGAADLDRLADILRRIATNADNTTS